MDHPYGTLTKSGSSSSSSSELDEGEDLQVEGAPPTWFLPRNDGEAVGKKKRLSKQMSLTEKTRETTWERRRRQFVMRMRAMNSGDVAEEGDVGDGGGGGAEEAAKTNKQNLTNLTDEDLEELKGSIDLGFVFNEEEGGQNLRDTLPALDLYFAVNRQFSDTKVYSPGSISSPSMMGGGGSSSSLDSPRSSISDSLNLNLGDDPQQVKTKLRHWAQVVACSVRQCSS